MAREPSAGRSRRRWTTEEDLHAHPAPHAQSRPFGHAHAHAHAYAQPHAPQPPPAAPRQVLRPGKGSNSHPARQRPARGDPHDVDDYSAMPPPKTKAVVPHRSSGRKPPPEFSDDESDGERPGYITEAASGYSRGYPSSAYDPRKSRETHRDIYESPEADFTDPETESDQDTPDDSDEHYNGRRTPFDKGAETVHEADDEGSRDRWRRRGSRRLAGAFPESSEEDSEAPAPMRGRVPFSPDDSVGDEFSPRLSESVPSRRRSRSQKGKTLVASRPPVVTSRNPRRGNNVGGSSRSEVGPRRSSTAPAVRSRASSLTRRPQAMSTFFGVTSPKTSPAKSEKGKEVKRYECVSCMSPKSAPKTALLKCGHRMCQPCLKRLFELSVTDPQHMPPKCCTKDLIPLNHVEKILDPAFKRTWNKKYTESTTRNRLYCPSKSCGEWIQPSQIRREGMRKSARCDHCSTKVCVDCNGNWHTSPDCPRDEETQRVLRQAKSEGWQRCFKCKNMVERVQGCNHMTCKWKTCECPWFTEDPPTDGDRLLADAGDMFDENGAGPSRALRERDEFGRISLRPRPRNHQDETRNRELQVRGDEQLARNLQIYGDEDDRDSEDDDDDDDDGSDDYEVRHDSGKRNGARPPGGLHYRQREHEKRGKGHAHAAPGRHSTPPQAESRYEKPPRGYERGPGKYIEVPRTRQRDRASRPGSMERRLASRLSEHRPPPPGPMGPPATPPMSHPAYMMGPNLSVPPTISPVGMGIPMGMPPPLQQSVSMPPTVPMMPPYPFMDPRDPRDLRDPPQHRERREHREHREHREPREHHREPREPREPREHREPRESREAREPRETRGPRQHREAQHNPRQAPRSRETSGQYHHSAIHNDLDDEPIPWSGVERETRRRRFSEEATRQRPRYDVDMDDDLDGPKSSTMAGLGIGTGGFGMKSRVPEWSRFVPPGHYDRGYDDEL